MKHIFALISVLLFSLTVSAQVYQHDKDKEKQILSLEAGHWDFSPDWYYYFMHKDYSGAYTKWEWHGFKSGLRVHFKETKSNVKTIAPRRLLQIEAMKSKAKVVEKEREQIKKLNAKLPPYKIIKRVKLRDVEFQKNTSRKIVRFTIDKTLD